MTDSSRKFNRRLYVLLSIALSIFVILFFILYIVVLFFRGFLFTNDSYKNYVNGGVYWSNSGSMSPCGEYLVFSSPKSGRGDIWRLRLSDSTMRRMTDTETFESYPQYSPNGKSIFYTREWKGHRHIWKMDKDGQAHEQLTFDRTNDTLLDISSDGDSLMIGRCYYAGGKGMAVTPAMIYSVSDKKVTGENIGSSGFFLDNHTLLYNTGRYGSPRFGKYDLATRQRHEFGSGFIKCLSPNKKTILIARDASRSSFLNDELFLFDIDEQSEKHIGTGMYPCFVGDSKVVFFVHPSLDRAYVYSLESDTTDEIELPGAILTEPTVVPDGRGALLSLGNMNDADRSGNIYLFDGNGIERLTQRQ